MCRLTGPQSSETQKNWQAPGASAALKRPLPWACQFTKAVVKKETIASSACYLPKHRYVPTTSSPHLRIGDEDKQDRSYNSNSTSAHHIDRT
jgi:hypothetical protein